ncbi:DUF6183 family protein [Streptomyces azureus]|uniref:DUF6183 family protein n=1 Tax=Streptomyces azureus TaxID=146537 RepID=UPI001F4647D9|nr:DUF6183 family protein [Streptomyces azureus]
MNGQGQGGAYARLYAWDSLCALMGPPADEPRTGSTTTRRARPSPHSIPPGLGSRCSHEPHQSRSAATA